jgi:hypothetical protein
MVFYTGCFTSNKEPNEICDAANITFALDYVDLKKRTKSLCNCLT